MSRQPIRTPALRRESRTGFTLLEVLLTSLLASIVLVSLWSLSDIYLKMFASGQRKIEETQLIRGLTAQMAKDVSQVIQLADEISDPDTSNNPSYRSSPLTSLSPGASRSLRDNSGARRPNPGNAPPQGNRPPPGAANRPPAPFGPGAPAPNVSGVATFGDSETQTGPNAQKQNQFIPRFGLFGTRQALRLIVLQPDPRTARGPSDLDEVLPEPGKQRTPFAMELRTIQYTFAPPHESNVNDQQHPGGLVRRDWAWEIWAGRMMATLPSTPSSSSASLLPVSESEWTSEDTLALQEDRDLFHVSQVIGMEFRYYDGEKWEIQWDSWERKRLPQLVEVLIKIRMAKVSPGTANPTEFDEADSMISLSEESAVSAPAVTGQGRVYRKLISLPFAEKSIGPGEHGTSQPLTEMAGSLSPGNAAGTRQP